MPSEIDQLKETLDGLARTWETFKSEHGTALKDVKGLSAERAEHKAKIERINTALDALGDTKTSLEKTIKENGELKARLDAMEVVMKRGGGIEKEVKDFAGNILTKDDQEHRGLFQDYLRKGASVSIETLKDRLRTPGKERKAMSIVSDQDGGYFVLPDFTGRMARRIYETSPMRQISSVQQIGGDALTGFTDIDQAGAGWAGETQARPQTDTPKVGQWRIPVHEIYALPYVSQQLLEDSTVENVESWVAQKVADKFSRLEETAFVNGDGNFKPRGFLTYTGGTTWGTLQDIDSVTTITAAGLMNTVYSLVEFWRTGANWLMTRTSQGIVRQIVDGQGRFLWQPGLEAGQPGLLLGYPVREAADMEEVSTGAGHYPVAFGNFREGYQIVDRIGLSILRDPYSAKPFVQFYCRKRVGGDVVNFQAIKRLKLVAP